MSDAMSFAQVEDHTAELLPARTVLSIMGARTMNSSVPSGQISNPTHGDHPMYDTWMYMLDLMGVPHASHAAPSSD